MGETRGLNFIPEPETDGSDIRGYPNPRVKLPSLSACGLRAFGWASRECGWPSGERKGTTTPAIARWSTFNDTGVAEPPELFQLKCLSQASGVVTHLNRNNPTVPQI
jgi:hypothetical protein